MNIFPVRCIATGTVAAQSRALRPQFLIVDGTPGLEKALAARPQRSAGLLYSLLQQPTKIQAALRTHSCGPEPANVAAFLSSLCEAEDQIGAVPYPHNVQHIDGTHGPRC